MEARAHPPKGAARAALAAALALVALALGLTLSGSPAAVTRSRLPLSALTELSTVAAPAQLCQAGETVPAGTTAVRLSLETLIGPPVSLTASADGRVFAHGHRGAGWSSGSVTIPVSPVARTHPDATVCVRISRPREQMNVDGAETAPGLAARDASGQPLAGRMFVEYLRPGDGSWWSRARAGARRMGLGHAFGGGGWVSVLAALAMAGVGAVSLWLIGRELA